MNIKAITAVMLASAAAVQMQAQSEVPAVGDSYDAAALSTEDLNGTARYVGMGGAMDALGADISTIGTNPAGIGLFRKGQVSTSFGFVNLQDAASFANANKTNVSFDQIGLVLRTRTGVSSFLNFGFNYHKSRNFNQILTAAAKLNGSSQSLQTTLKDMNGLLNKNSLAYSQLDDIYLGNLLLQEDPDTHEKYVVGYGGDMYDFNRATSGYIGNYDINISGNIKNRLYLGLTIGISDVHYKDYSEYYETLQPNQDHIDGVLISDQHNITGTGFNIKAGAIFRPIEESPFRIGLSVATPTFYKLTTENYTTIGSNVDKSAASEDFRFNTPWKFGISLGHTIGNQIALGAVYEYADYGSCDMRTIDDAYYDYYDGYHENSSSEFYMNQLTKKNLKGVSTIKLGGEFRPDKSFAIRLGYNHVTPMFNKGAVRDQTIDSPGVYYASTTDYTNWGATDRITAGVGFTFDKFRLDLAYQYSQRNGDFYPFMSYYSADYIDADNVRQTEVNECSPVSVSDKRHQVLCTLSYSF